MELRVFPVEDLQRMRGLLHDLFASIGGFRVVAVASTEAEASLWLHDNAGQWDLAIVDLVLEQGAGMNVVRACKADPNGGRIVVFSSYASPGCGSIASSSARTPSSTRARPRPSSHGATHWRAGKTPAPETCRTCRTQASRTSYTAVQLYMRHFFL
ncbi:response regulator [Ramlibacter terrae]|uniref:Response regulator n=1 Tax=Ramlibacter terrae TaxID=2732511 RepID=A0ABX6NZG6_9BURK|nr:response regulator [Ramlibacter terrae]